VIAISLIVFGRAGLITRWVVAVQDQLLLNVDRSIVARLAQAILVRIAGFRHFGLLGSGLIAYALLEGTEGVGLAMRRRWAEYLTVIATALLIPYEVYEVVRAPTLFKVSALLLNVAVVGWLGCKKRLFVDV
jgi:uncharacterized membrane protein (DUF2068 family)